MALLRNCATPDSAAYGLALKLLVAILNLPRIRLGLRAELGAFYPLLVLRYLEQLQAYLASATLQQQQQQVQAPDPASVAAALSALQGLLADPQLLVDLYVNFDCDLQAANLFERTVQVGSCWSVMCVCVGGWGLRSVCFGAFVSIDVAEVAWHNDADCLQAACVLDD